MRKLLIGLLAVVFVLGMSSGVMADEYLEPYNIDEGEVSSTFDVDIDIAPYVQMGSLDDLELDNLAPTEYSNYAEDVEPEDISSPGEFPDPITDENENGLYTSAEIVANFDFVIDVSSSETGLDANDDRGNENNHLNDLLNYYTRVDGGGWTGVYTAENGPGQTLHPESRTTYFEFLVDFADNADWEEYTAGNYTDTITVTVSSTLHH